MRITITEKVLIIISALLSVSESFQSIPAFGFTAKSQSQHRGHFLAATLADATSATTSSPNVRTVSIEYCTGHRWMLKSFWIAQELLTTFENDLSAVTLIPSSTSGIFSVRLAGQTVLWDRVGNGGGFPSPKILKQLIRDKVFPEKSLGHSDTKERQQMETTDAAPKDSNDFREPKDASVSLTLSEIEAPRPSVTIKYCTGCRWLLRAAYLGQELLTTFPTDIKSIALVPSTGGRFSVEANGELVFDRATEGRFPEVQEIKKLIRDKILPGKHFGHSENTQDDEQDDQTDPSEEENEAATQRNFFGVL